VVPRIGNGGKTAMEPSMQQIAEWLESLGMSAYAQRAENGVSIVALRYVTDQDLKDIGVLLEHRADNARSD
jgi:hypothetical protein